MYEEGSSNVSIKGIVVKILLIALVICVLIWIFPTKKDLEESMSGISVNPGTNVNIDPLLDQIFNQNIQTLNNAGHAYYYNATLPKNVGESVSITYQELLNKKYLVELKDKTGNACNGTSSYVKLTKTGTNKYQMTTFLQCSNEQNSVVTNIGCTDLCPNACTATTPVNPTDDDKEGGDSKPVEETKTYKYLYSCPSSTSEWGSWSDWSTTYVSSTSNRDVQTKIVSGTSSSTPSTIITGYKTVGTGTYKTTYTTVKYRNTFPSGAKNCDNGTQKYDSKGFYLEFTCTTETKTEIMKEEPIYETVYNSGTSSYTMYRYRTKTTQDNSYSVWDTTDKNTVLLNRGCSIVKSELVTTK